VCFMTDKELKKLSRADLLEMLIEQSKEVQYLRERLYTAEKALEQKEIYISTSGSIAEAALKLNGVFEAAEAASRQYLENVRMSAEQKDAVEMRIESIESKLKAAVEKRITEVERQCEAMEAETKRKCEALEAETEKRCKEMLFKAKGAAF